MHNIKDADPTTGSAPRGETIMATAKTRNERGYRDVGGMMLAVTLAAMIGGLSVTQASADDNDQSRNGQPDRGYQDQRDHGYQDQRRPEPSYRYDAPRYVYV